MGNPFSVPFPSEQASGQTPQPKPAGAPGNPFSVPFASEATQQPQQPVDYSDPTGGGSATNTPEARAEQSSTLQSAAVGAIKEVGRQGYGLVKMATNANPLIPIGDLLTKHTEAGIAIDKKVNDALAAKNDHERIGGYATLGFQFAAAFPELAERLLPGMAKRATAAEEGASAVSRPSTVQNLIKGKGVAQEPAQAAIREAVGANEGAPLLSGDQTVVDSKLADVAQQAKTAYAKRDAVAGFDTKTAEQDLVDYQRAVKQPGQSAEVIERTNTKIADIKSKLADAQGAMKEAGIDPKEAPRLFQSQKAGSDFKKALVRNTDVNGVVKVDPFITSLKNLQFSKYGNRLEQFFGKDGATSLMGNLQQAQADGVHAIKVRAIAKWVAGGIAGVGGAIEGISALTK
jgi:hypothetical protein